MGVHVLVLEVEVGHVALGDVAWGSDCLGDLAVVEEDGVLAVREDGGGGVAWAWTLEVVLGSGGLMLSRL